MFGQYYKKQYLCTRKTEISSGENTQDISAEHNGRLAQLVQSICLTSRGSAVRIRHRPQNLIGMAP